jgi:hypothetical protein
MPLCSCLSFPMLLFFLILHSHTPYLPLFLIVSPYHFLFQYMFPLLSRPLLVYSLSCAVIVLSSFIIARRPLPFLASVLLRTSQRV